MSPCRGLVTICPDPLTENLSKDENSPSKAEFLWAAAAAAAIISLIEDLDHAVQSSALEQSSSVFRLFLRQHLNALLCCRSRKSLWPQYQRHAEQGYILESLDKACCRIHAIMSSSVFSACSSNSTSWYPSSIGTNRTSLLCTPWRKSLQNTTPRMLQSLECVEGGKPHGWNLWNICKYAIWYVLCRALYSHLVTCSMMGVYG